MAFSVAIVANPMQRWYLGVLLSLSAAMLLVPHDAVAKDKKIAKPSKAPITVKRTSIHKTTKIRSNKPNVITTGKQPFNIKPAKHRKHQRMLERDHEKRDARYLHTGIASYYSDKFQGGRTASGERFDQNKFTCAHGSLPFGCKLRVTNLRNNRSVEVKVNDRGNFHKHGRVIDLSKAAASQIGMLGTGTARVTIEVLE